MLRKLLLFAVCILPTAGLNVPNPGTSANDENGVREFIEHWNAAYTHMDPGALASLETADYEMVDRFGHWIKSEGPQFNQRLWEMAFGDIYRGKPGPARMIESIRFFGSRVAVVQARANHPDVTVLDDGTRIAPFWEIDTYTLVKGKTGWQVALLNIHNQINPQDEKPGEHLPSPRRKL